MKIKIDRKRLAWKVRKHCRWLKRFGIPLYRRQVRRIEREIGGQIEAC
jgi:hypothetical protein